MREVKSNCGHHENADCQINTGDDSCSRSFSVYGVYQEIIDKNSRHGTITT
uniref:Uncharacterized protein n=1 Tax=Rhizophora mucronata TaxID=61149 RepID=A0A2P2KM82_RHIMU